MWNQIILSIALYKEIRQVGTLVLPFRKNCVAVIAEGLTFYQGLSKHSTFFIVFGSIRDE